MIRGGLRIVRGWVVMTVVGFSATATRDACTEREYEENSPSREELFAMAAAALRDRRDLVAIARERQVGSAMRRGAKVAIRTLDPFTHQSMGRRNFSR